MYSETRSFICLLCDKGHEITLSFTSGIEYHRIAPEQMSAVTLSYKCPIKLLYNDHTFFVPKPQASLYNSAQITGIRNLSKAEEEELRNE
jgi:hypothetical protein